MSRKIKDVALASAQQNDASRPSGERVRATLQRPQYQESQRWSFGFRFLKEIKNFGLDSGEIDKKWPLSVMYRLGDLSALTLGLILENHVERTGTLRIHNINWDNKNIPIARKELDWIAAEYLNNEDEFPLMQLAISKAEGRLVGFLDEQNVFQIVLLDPLHNAQPSKYNDYAVKLCKPLGCELTAIRHAAQKAISIISQKSCGCAHELKDSLDWTRSQTGFALVMPVDDPTVIEDANTIIDEYKLATSYRDIFLRGIDAMLEEADVASTDTLSSEN